MPTAYIALGSNLPSPAGTPRQTLDAAVVRLALLGAILAESCYLETAPVGFAEQPMFLNAVLAMETALTPQSLLKELLRIELELGRDRSHGIPNGPRTLDLDLLLYEDLVLSTQSLQLPHPRMLQRAFVLVPLLEIAPELIHPQVNKSVSQLVQELHVQ